MPRKSALLLHLLNLVLRPIAGQTSASSNQLVASPQHPPAHDREAWRVYWQAQGQPWRTEPEIDVKRQQELTQHRAIAPNIEQGIYPFRGMKLSRADVEWLLTTHDGHAPVDWSDEYQHEPMGLDLRGTDLSYADLRNLPLMRLCGGLTWDIWRDATEEQRDMAAVLMEGANLSYAHLKMAFLRGARMKGANLNRAHLEGAYLRNAHLEEARLTGAHLQGAYIKGTYLQRADLRGAHLEGAELTGAILGDESYIGPRLSNVYWNNTNLTAVKWSQIYMLGDEYVAKQRKNDYGEEKGKVQRLEEYEIAVRANRQLVAALQEQGLNEVAIRFAYRAQVLQKHVFWWQMLQRGAKLRQRISAFGAWLFSWFLFLLAGYGYRLWRSFLAYVLVIIGFMTAYYLLGASDLPPLSLVNALGLSMTSFHGRGFFPGVTQLNDTLTILASLEAFVGLILEATFIATLTQRFFGK